MKYQTINAGDHFGRLETLERIKIGRRIAWICKCSCGNTRAVLSQNLNNGTTKSCGCYNREAASQRIREINFKHGRTPRRLYEAWKNMRRRCTEEDKTGCYFNRGIKVCEEWQKDFIPFREWALSHGYQNNLTLDRINVNGNYTPDNCRWITQVEQCNNKRTNRHIVFNNEEHTLAEWSRILGVSYATIKYRANHNLPLINVMSKTGKFDISKKRDSKKRHIAI